MIPEKGMNSIQFFNSDFINNIKDPYIHKSYKKSCFVIHTYNNENNNLILIYLSKISQVSQGISFHLTIII